MKSCSWKLLVTLTGWIVLFGSITGSCWAQDYYVDANKGLDRQPGTHQAPWQSVAKVNSFAFKPGDRIFFRSGQAWKGKLVPVSGGDDKPIIYTSFGNGEKPVIAACTINQKKNIVLKGLHLRSANPDYPLYIGGSSHIRVESCRIEAESSSTANDALLVCLYSHHNSIIDCTIAHRNMNIQNDALNLKHDASYNLIEGNRIGPATHYALSLEGSSADRPDGVCSYNIIRNNAIDNPAGAVVELQSNSSRNVVEGNRITGGRATRFNNNAPHLFKSVSSRNIIRHNIIHDNPEAAGFGLSSYAYRYGSYPANNVIGNRIYNNLITAVYRQPVVIDNYNPKGSVLKDNVYKNNIVYNNGTKDGYQFVLGRAGGIGANYFRNNLFYKQGVADVLTIRGTPISVAGIESREAAHFRRNLQKDPLLQEDFRLKPASPCIDTGDFLTEVASGSGTGSVIRVEDAGYFSDGFGIGAGDAIRIGAVTTRITKVDYATNTITVADAVKWEKGAPVSLPYEGERPDIGPFEAQHGSRVAGAETQ